MAWIPTGNPGVRYREHATRRHLGAPDKYFSLRYYVNGKSHEEGLGWARDGWTAKKAVAVLAELRKAQTTGEGPQTLRERREQSMQVREAARREEQAAKIAEMTLAEFFDRHYLPAKKTKTSWPEDEYRFNRWVRPGIGRMPMRSIAKGDIERLLGELGAAGAAQATVNQYHALLRQICNMALHTSIDGVLVLDGQSPVVGIKMPDPRNGRDRFLSYEEADKLIAAAAAKSIDLSDTIVVSLNTGLRFGEIQRMEWSDVDLRHDMLTVRDDPKHKPGGKIPLNPDVKAVLQARLDRRKGGTPRVFPGVKGDERDCRSEFERIVRALGLNDGVTNRLQRVVFHTLRHTFASWLALAGTDIYRIKTLMRHKTLRMTERYAHLIPDATRAAVHNLRPPTAP